VNGLAEVSNKETNVSAIERVASAAIGGALVFSGLRKFSAGGVARAAIGADLLYRGIGGHCQIYEKLGVSTANGRELHAGARSDAPEVRRSITIGRPVEEVYAFWRDPQNLAKIVAHFADVTPAGENRTHWRIRGPLDRTAEWTSEHFDDDARMRQSWKTVPESKIGNEGTVEFRLAPDSLGTEVHLYMRFEVPGGAAGRALARKLRFAPRLIAEKTLRRLKALMETGEIPTLAHNPSARKGAMANIV
jgi:uncharacterized membrane protein